MADGKMCYSSMALMVEDVGYVCDNVGEQLSLVTLI